LPLRGHADIIVMKLMACAVWTGKSPLFIQLDRSKLRRQNRRDGPPMFSRYFGLRAARSSKAALVSVWIVVTETAAAVAHDSDRSLRLFRPTLYTVFTTFTMS
jgi:hypothetical protein